MVQAPGVVFTTLHFITNGPNKLEYYITLSWEGFTGTNTSLLDPLISYEENESGLAQCYKTFYVRN